ncbi:Dcp1p-Dcp2p decapping enzyme complex alpha subunit [Elasticomyces elasticus]|nr:Dcp1p-Dcp2p decapping enzyme complex alpha subunit [Elasticomyces elasticus]KAK3638597.1 Dcp1p-Dcp2p decapping enzyme complex alpha subunit [Elasticomyces elasticus]KAK5757583.1 Dcp1p-Dcp2p decapping enzyme complex alpha subunit [Elasticomyces elasticus]
MAGIDLAQVGTKLDPQDAADNRNYVADLLGRRQITFPGAQPVSFARSHLDELKQQDYYLCEKTDGIRCLMYLSSYSDNGVVHEAQFLIDRKNDYYFIPNNELHIPAPPQIPGGGDFDLASFHTGTLLDGELVLQTRGPQGAQRLTYLMFDVLAIDGQSVMNRTFDKRMAKLQSLIYRPYKKFAQAYPTDAAHQPFDIQMKDMELPYAAEMMFKDKIPNLPHGNDGLIFTCVSTQYTPGTDEKILKWKPPHENTIDFRIEIKSFPKITDEETGEQYEDWDDIPEIELQINHGDKEGYQYYAILVLTSQEWSALKGLNQMLDHRIVECFREPTTGQWRPKCDLVNGVATPRFRDDKTESNHISTVRSVEVSIRDAVSEQDLITHAGEIKVAYKARVAKRDEAAAVAAAAHERKRREAAARAQVAAQKTQAAPQQAAQAQAPADDVMDEEEDDGPRYED